MSTTDIGDPVELAQTYIHRWSAQENVIKDYLRPLGLDTNHGFAKTRAENSEVAKQQSKLEKRLARLKQWTQSASRRQQQAKERHARLRVQFQSQCKTLGDTWGWYQTVPTLCSGTDPLKRQEIKERNAKLDAVWLRLLPFFQLPGTITRDATTIQVELSPFNDRALNRDLAQLCERVNQASPRLPDGRQLSFTIRSTCCFLPAQKASRIT